MGRWKTMTGIHLVLTVFLLFLILSSQNGYSQHSTNYTLQRSVIDQAGAASQSTNYKATDAVGQPFAIGVATSTNYRADMGFLGGFILDTGVAETDETSIPSEFGLFQNHPNPFNPETVIEFQVPLACDVLITIHDIHGRKVHTLIHEQRSAGFHSIIWDGRGRNGQMVASGMYFYRLEARATGERQRSFMDVKKMIFMK
jgi:hypothetical protein